jgi:predicted nucleic acid-binding protein
MIIADTNLIIPLLIEHEGREKALKLLQHDPDWHLPDWWQIEVANALRNYERAGLFSRSTILEIQFHTNSIFPPSNTHPVDLTETLKIACDQNLSAYDARFIALARMFGLKLVTEDQRLRKACPNDTLSLDEALGLYS